MKQSIRNVGYIPITETGKAVSYGDIIYFATAEAGGREYSSNPKGDIQKEYANGELAFSVDNNAGYDIDLTLLDLIDDVEKNWYGKELVTGNYNGVAEYADSKELPKFALIIHEDTTDGAGKISFYPYCQVSSRTSKSGKTKEEGAFDFAFAQHKIIASPRPTDQLVCFEFAGTEKLTAPPEPKSQSQDEGSEE